MVCLHSHQRFLCLLRSALVSLSTVAHKICRTLRLHRLVLWFPIGVNQNSIAVQSNRKFRDEQKDILERLWALEQAQNSPSFAQRRAGRTLSRAPYKGGVREHAFN